MLILFTTIDIALSVKVENDFSKYIYLCEIFSIQIISPEMQKISLRNRGEAFTAFYCFEWQNYQFYQFNCFEQQKVVKLLEL